VIRPIALISAIAAVVIATAPAGAQVPPIEDYVPTFTRADQWLHRNTGPIGNVDAYEGRYLKWDGTKPTGDTPALYSGNNYLVFVGELHDPVHFITMKGNAAGDLDNIAFDLYLTGWAQSTIGCSMSLSFQLIIDGVTILDQDYTGSDGISYTPIDDTTVLARFALTNLWEATKVYELPYGPDVQHEVYLNLQNFYACNEYIWQYDSADRPAGLIVNLPSPGSKGYTRIDVLDPPPPVQAS
jgi:hypothetical protein